MTDLRKLAEACLTDGIRWTEPGPHGTPRRDYISACDPAEILALLDRAEAAERERAEERHLADVRGEMLTKAEADRETILGAIGTLKDAQCDRDHWRSVAESRPEITPEDAAAYLRCVGVDTPSKADYDTACVVDAALRAHAAKSRKDGDA